MILSKQSRLAIVTESFYPVSDAPSIRMTALVDALRANGHFDIKVYSSKKAAHEYKGISVRQNICPPSHNKQSSIRRILNELVYGVETLLRLFFAKYDIIIVTSPPFISTVILSYFLIFFKRNRYVLDVRDYYPSVYFEAGLIKKESLPGKFFLKREKKLYDNALFVTAATQGLVDEIGLKSNNAIHLFRNGYDANVFDVQEKNKTGFEVMFHGSLSKFQDIEGLIKVAKRLNVERPEILVKVIGEGSQSYLLEESTLSNLEYLGKMNYQDVAKHVMGTSLGISLRTDGLIGKTAFPVKVYEYIGAGIPVVCTPISEAGEFIKDHKLGFQFKSDEIEKIVNNIIELYENPDLYDSIRANVIGIRETMSRKAQCDSFVNSLIKAIEQ